MSEVVANREKPTLFEQTIYGPNVSDQVVAELAAFDQLNFVGRGRTTSELYQPPVLTEADIREGLQRGQSFYLYRSEDGRLAGVMQTVERAKGGQADLHLMSLAVAPEFRGTGLSQVMMKRFYELAEKKSLDLVTLRVDPLNTAALKLYLKEGFVVVGARTRNLGEGYDNIVTLAMTKSQSVPFGEFSSSAEKQQCQIDDYENIDRLTADGWIGVTLHEGVLTLVQASEDQRSVYKHWH